MLTETFGFAQPGSLPSSRETLRMNSNASVARIVAAGPVAIDLRLNELDEEWDAFSALQTLTPLTSLFGISLGLSLNVAWFVLPIVMLSFALQQAILGWSLPFAALRWAGVRTEWEIDEERYALNHALAGFVDRNA